MASVALLLLAACSGSIGDWSHVAAGVSSGNTIEDNFIRPDQQYFGTTSNVDELTNVAWQGDVATASDCAISSHAGVVAYPGSTSFLHGYLGSTRYIGGDLLVQLAFSNAGTSQLWLKLDASRDNENYYAFALRNYNNTIVLNKKVNGAFTSLTSTSFGFLSGKKYWARLHVGAGLVQARVWPEGSTEPSSWAVAASADPGLTQGLPGVTFNWQGAGSGQTISLSNAAFAFSGLARPAPLSYCVPTTCLAAGANCGTMSDGCGGTLNCGLPPSGYLCGSSTPNLIGHQYFISPNGSDANPGTRMSPFLTFAYVVPKLQPGDRLVLLDGTYTKSNSGMLRVNCSSNAVSGIAGAPITVIADHPRHAFLSGDGTEGQQVLIYKCSYWDVVGLHARSNDAVSAHPGSVFDVQYSNDITLYRCMGEYNNRMYNTQVFSLANSSYCSVVECEAYNYHRHGFDALETTSQGNVFQRNYANARPGGRCLAAGTSEDGGVHCAFDLTCDAAGLCGGITGTQCFCVPPQPDGGPPDSGSCLPAWQRAAYPRCGWPSHNTEFGDEGITQYWAYDGFVENNVTLNGEGQQATGVGNVLAGGVSLYEETGVHLGRNSSFAQNGDFEHDNRAHDMVVVGPAADGTTQTGALLCGDNDQVANLTLVRPGDGFWAIGHDAGWCQPYWTPDASVSFTFTDSVIVDPAHYGAVSTGVQDSHTVEFVDVWSPDVLPTILFSPKLDGGFWGNAFSRAVTGTGVYDPTTGQGNLLYVPAGSSLKGAGLNGADIGANVTCLYDHGVLTQKPMWNPGDGRFVGCDWYDAGSPDDIAASEGYLQHCSTVHTLVNVGVNGGSIPLCPAP